MNRIEIRKMIAELIQSNRSCRRFYEDHKIDMITLRDLVELARLSPSAANLQPLRFILSNTEEKNRLIFSCLAWAGYLKDWPGPAEGERPSAYIVVLGDTTISKHLGWDSGIACHSVLLGARELGLAGCMIGAVNKPKLRQFLKIPDHYEIILVVALGKPKENVVLDTVGEDGDIRYWRDKFGNHHVPKRKREDMIVSFDA